MKNNIIGILGQAGAGKDTTGDLVAMITEGGEKMALADPMKSFAKRVFGFTDDQLWGPSELRNAPDYRFGMKPWQVWKAYGVKMTHAMVMSRLCDIETFDWLVDLFPDAKGAELNIAWARLVIWGRGVLQQAERDGYLTPRKVLQTVGTEWGRDFSHNIWIDLGIRRAKEKLENGAKVVVITDCRFLNEAKVLHEEGAVWRITRPGYDGSLANSAGVANHRSERDQHSDEIAQYVSEELLNDKTIVDLEDKVFEALKKYGILDANGDVQGGAV